MKPKPPIHILPLLIMGLLALVIAVGCTRQAASPTPAAEKKVTAAAPATRVQANATPTKVPSPIPTLPPVAPPTKAVEIPVVAKPDSGSAPTPTPTRPAPTPTPTQSAATVRPATYMLQPGEYPFCIARRFNVDGWELLAINGLSAWQVFYPGQVLVIPQTGNPWSGPGPRTVWAHPAEHVVGYGETIYTIACLYGDIDPLELAKLNNLQTPYTLYLWQVLKLPAAMDYATASTAYGTGGQYPQYQQPVVVYPEYPQYPNWYWPNNPYYPYYPYYPSPTPCWNCWRPQPSPAPCWNCGWQPSEPSLSNPPAPILPTVNPGGGPAPTVVPTSVTPPTAVPPTPTTAPYP